MLLELAELRESLTGTWQRKKIEIFPPLRAVGAFVQPLSSSPRHPTRLALCQFHFFPTFLSRTKIFPSRIYIASRSAAPFCWCIIKHVFWKMKEADDKRESLWFPSELQSQPHFPTVYLSFPLLRLRGFIIWPPPVPSASFFAFHSRPLNFLLCSSFLLGFYFSSSCLVTSGPVLLIVLVEAQGHGCSSGWMCAHE